MGAFSPFEIQRCEPLSDLPCTPAGVAIVGPRATSHVDFEDRGDLHWYRVIATGDCVP